MAVKSEKPEVSRRVLVVDDSNAVRREITRLLVHSGFTALEAPDGLTGLKIAREQAVSLIILDINMPNMNGLEMLERLRLDFATASIPVVILTTEAEALMVQRARKAGAKGWLIKPVSGAHLMRMVQGLVNRQPGQRLEPV